MGGKVLVRIIAPALLDESNALELQRGGAPGLFGRGLAAHVYELLERSEALGEHLAVMRRAVCQRTAQLGEGPRWVLDFRGNGVDGVGVVAAGEDSAAAVEDLTA